MKSIKQDLERASKIHADRKVYAHFTDNLNKQEDKMAKLNEEASAYEPTAKIKNIAELQTITTDLEVKEELNCEFPYKYIVVNNEHYRVPISVLANLKAILEENPNLKKFKVKKTGEGMETKYTVIPLG